MTKKAHQKESRKSESNVNVSENPLNFIFARKLSDSDNIWIWTPTYP